MNRDEEEILDEFFILLNKVRDVLLVNRPELSEYTKLRDFRDPFGKYFQIILFIGNNRSTAMSDFASRFKLKAGTATGIIDQLVEKEIVARKANPDDRRKVEIILAEKGKTIYEKVRQIQKDEIRSVLDALNPQDMVNAKKILQKINSALIIKERTAQE